MTRSGAFAAELASQGLSKSEVADIIAFLIHKPYKPIFPRDILLDDADVRSVREALAIHTPIAFITGRKEFYGREFTVTPDVLIPRPETEVLIEAVLHDFQDNSINIIDLYTGSGCILLTLLAEIPDSKGIGVDISPAALSVAQQNAYKLGVANKCSFIEADIMSDAFTLPFYDGINIVTANPPYVSEDEYNNAAPSLYFEPRIALVGADSGYAHYKKLLSTLSKSGNNEVYFYMEIGAAQAEKICAIALDFGLNVRVIKDLAGLDRVLCGFCHPERSE